MKSFVLVVLSFLVSSPCVAQYSFTKVDYPGAAITRLIGLNDHGEMVGHYIVAVGQARHAFKYSHGTCEPLDPAGILGTHESAANQINNRGEITGWYADGGTRHGYVLRDGVVQTIDYPGATLTQVNGVSDTGIVFGHFKDVAQAVHGFILQDGVFTQIDFPGALSTYPYYINTRGDVAGNYYDAPGPVGHGFVLTKEDEWIGFDAPGAPANSTLAIGINDRRQILGYYRQSSGQLRTFLVGLDALSSSDGFTFIDLQEGAVTPETMNNTGVFVGFYTDPSGTHGLIADPTGGWRD